MANRQTGSGEGGIDFPLNIFPFSSGVPIPTGDCVRTRAAHHSFLSLKYQRGLAVQWLGTLLLWSFGGSNSNITHSVAVCPWANTPAL